MHYASCWLLTIDAAAVLMNKGLKSRVGTIQCQYMCFIVVCGCRFGGDRRQHCQHINTATGEVS
uniref:Uncharacterized protein n=1 Tax=Nelumbo nucifera TaxID=4432 RepID=A0A822YS89_NELNU|nr:TPA_asm: hypothetical protein HUJ06_004929 [Nelumbo nucifera]